MGPVTVVATVLGLVNDAPGAISLMNHQNGNIVLSYKGESVQENSERNLIVCLDESGSAGLLTGIYPVIANNTRYGVNNLAMRYDIRTQNVSIEPTDYYTFVQEEPNAFTLKYKDPVLPAFTTVERPLKKIHLVGNQGSLYMKVRTSYDGITHPLQYGIQAELMVVPYPDNKDYNDWKRICQQQFLKNTRSLKQCDVYYLSEKYGSEQEINYLLEQNTAKVLEIERKSEQVVRDAQPKKEVEQSHPNSDETLSAARNLSSINLRIHKDKSSDKVYVQVPDLKKDTVIMVLALLEDTLTQEKYNELWAMNYQKKYNGMSWHFHCNENFQLIDYALCSENPALKDSVEINESGIITNPLLRAIAVFGKRKSDTGDYYECYEIINPKEKQDAISRYFQIDNLVDLRFLELPENVLVEKYKPIDSYEWIRNNVRTGSNGALVFAFFALFVVLIFGILRLVEERKNIDSMQDVRYYILDEYEEKSIAQAILKLVCLVIVVYVGVILIVFSVEAIYRLFI